MNAAANLIHAVVDYAGLFPPAGLPLDRVINNYARYVSDNRHQMLGKLVVPAGQLEAVESEISKLSHAKPQPPWPISALVRPLASADKRDAESDLAAISGFNLRQQQTNQAVVKTIEVKSESGDAVKAWAKRLPSELTAFLEIDWRSDPGPLIQEVAQASLPNLKAKIRSGGMSPELIPESSAMARFISRCAQYQVGFKATAGLHHPLRGDYRLTYQPDAQLGTMHGFVNVFVAATLAFAGEADEQRLVEILDSRDPDKFTLGETHVGFESTLIDANAVSTIRKQYVASFGSCSFDEPSEEVTPLLQQE